MNSEQLQVAYHEAAHVTAAVLTGFQFRYVTLRPRYPDAAGHVISRGNDALWRAGRWQAPLVVYAAGAIAEDLLADGSDSRDRRRRQITYVSSDDLRMYRNLCRYTLAKARAEPSWPHTPIHPNWNVAGLAAVTWSAAAQCITGHWAAVRAVGEALLDALTLTQTQVRGIVRGASTAGDRTPAFADGTFWPAAYSRLAWTTSTRSRARVAA